MAGAMERALSAQPSVQGAPMNRFINIMDLLVVMALLCPFVLAIGVVIYLLLEPVIYF